MMKQCTESFKSSWLLPFINFFENKIQPRYQDRTKASDFHKHITSKETQGTEQIFLASPWLFAVVPHPMLLESSS